MEWQLSAPTLTAALTGSKDWAEAYSIELKSVKLIVATKTQYRIFVHEMARETGKGLAGSEVGGLAVGYTTGEDKAGIAGLFTEGGFERDDTKEQLKGLEQPPETW